MQASTAKCSRYGHPEFVLTCSDECAFDVPWLVDLLERQVASGSTFREGQTLQLGWSVLRFEADPAGNLHLLELDLSGKPGKFDRSVTRTLLALRLQKSVLESLGIQDQLLFPSLLQTALRCRRFGKTSQPMLIRSEPTAEDSGWFFGCREESHSHDDPNELEGGVLHELASEQPILIEYLAMPTGSMILLDARHRYLSACDGDDVEHKVLPGSYLALKYPPQR